MADPYYAESAANFPREVRGLRRRNQRPICT